MGMRQSFGLFQPSILHDTAITTADFSLATALQNVVWGGLAAFCRTARPTGLARAM